MSEDRIIMHVDVDSFYAQVEELRNPALRGRPVGVTQKYLVVTTNYEARRQGVGKLMGIQEAQQVCPDIALVCGEDLSVYRACSRSLRAVLARFGVTQARGLDEVTVDITALAKERLTAPGWIPRVQGHVFLASTRLVQEGMHRVQDLRAAPPQQPPSHAHSARHPLSHSLPHSANPAPGDREDAAAWRDEGTNPQDSGTRSPGQAWSDRRADGDRGGGTVGEWVERLRAEGMEDAVGVLTMLAAGSQVAMDIRRAVKEEVGLRCSAGVACNQMLAKLCSGIHKPDDQTVMPPSQAAQFLAPLPIRVIPGVGSVACRQLSAIGVKTVSDARAASEGALVAAVGEPLASQLRQWIWGRDDRPVTHTGPPKTVSVEDSFRQHETWEAVEVAARRLAPDLAERVAEEREESGRVPRTLVVGWRERTGARAWKRATASTGMPRIVTDPSASDASKADVVCCEAMRVLRANLSKGFRLSLLSLGASGFIDCGGPSILQWAHRSQKGTKRQCGDGESSRKGTDDPVVSKRQRRRMAERRMHGGAACAGDGGGEGERDGDVMCRGAGERSEMGEGFLLRGEVEKCQELGEGEEGRRGGEMEKGEGTNSRGGGGGEEPEEKGRGEEGARSDLDASHGRNAAEAEEQETRSEDGKWIDLDEGDDVWLELEGDGAGDDRGTRMCVGWWDAIAYDELGEIPGDWGPYDPSC